MLIVIIQSEYWLHFLHFLSQNALQKLFFQFALYFLVPNNDFDAEEKDEQSSFFPKDSTIIVPPQVHLFEAVPFLEQDVKSF